MRQILSLLLLLFVVTGYASATNFTYPVITPHGNGMADFVPSGWHVLSEANGAQVLATAHGDLNGDTLPDIAMVIECDKDLNAENGEVLLPGNQHKPRILLLLFQTRHGGYRLSAQGNDVIMCADEGGVFGDPFAGMSINRVAVVLHFYGGSAWRWDIRARFRFQHAGWYLIGLTVLSYHDGSGVMTESDYNLSTGKIKRTAGNLFDKKHNKVSWKTPGKKTVTLAEYHTWFQAGWQKIAGHG